MLSLVIWLVALAFLVPISGYGLLRTNSCPSPSNHTITLWCYRPLFTTVNVITL